MFITLVVDLEENISFNKMIKRALQDIYLHNPNIKWNDIIGLSAAKQLVKEAVVYPIKVRPGSLQGGIFVHYPLNKPYVIDPIGREGRDGVLSASQGCACAIILACPGIVLSSVGSLETSPISFRQTSVLRVI